MTHNSFSFYQNANDCISIKSIHSFASPCGPWTSEGIIHERKSSNMLSRKEKSSVYVVLLLVQLSRVLIQRQSDWWEFLITIMQCNHSDKLLNLGAQSLINVVDCADQSNQGKCNICQKRERVTSCVKKNIKEWEDLVFSSSKWETQVSLSGPAQRQQRSYYRTFAVSVFCYS